jgi:hypothetical protein
MIKAPKWTTICAASNARLKRGRQAAERWWCDVQADPERRTNLFVLYGSYLLTGAAIAGLFWLTGSFELRGSDGDTGLTLIISCNKPSDAEYETCKKDIDNSDQITAILDLKPRSDTKYRLDLDIGRALAGHSELFPIMGGGVAGLQVISTRAFTFLPNHSPNDARVTLISGAWYSSLIRPVVSFGIAFPNMDLLRYSGLSERAFSITGLCS